MKLNSSIQESPRKYSSKNILELPNGNEWVIIQLRKEAEEFIARNNDADTVDFLARLIEQHETTSLILETT